MKIVVKITWLLLILPVYCFAKPLNHLPNSTVYTVETSRSKPNALIIHVERSNKNSATHLILRGISLGISEQVKNVACDGKPIKQNKPGVWAVPSHCQKLQWEVPLLESETQFASAQQSIKSGNFILFSEASSLLRLEDGVGPEILKISVPNVRSIYPTASSQREIILPSVRSAPCFVLLNAVILDSVSSEKIKLTYILDHPKAVSMLPSIVAHMNALKWLNTVIPSGKNDFVLAWLGISKERMSLAGAAGDNILLTNYPNNGELKFGNVMLLYVALHEAFHQLAMSYGGKQPSWLSESLASYYGARAIQIGLPNDTRSLAMIERFQTDGNKFVDGLLAINRKVESGDRSEYGAFYTKGLAFWAAVDKVLQAQGESLDQHLIAIFRTKFDAHGNPLDLQNILNLSPYVWMLLRNRFLD